jgi:hypothetical protein
MSIETISYLILQVIITITANNTTPATVTPPIRPTQIQMNTANKTTPATATSQIRPTQIQMIGFGVPNSR